MTISSRFTNRFPALSSRDFLIFWTGQFISLIGTWMQSTTQPYLAYRLTGSPFDLGLIGFASALPTLLVTLPAGVVVERLDKRKTVISMQVVMMLQAFTLAYLALSGLVQVWHIVILAFILGTASSIEVTARQAMLVELVGKPALPNAIALQATIFNAARILGPLLFAPFLVTFKGGGEGWAFLLNGFSYLFVIVGLLFVRTPFKIPHTVNGNEHKEDSFFRQLVSEFKEGARFVVTSPPIFGIIILAGLMGFFGFPFNQQLPAFARDTLSSISDTATSAATRTSILYVSQGIGAFIAAITLASFSNFRRKGRLMMVGEIAFSVSLILVGFASHIAPATILIGIIGWGLVTQLALKNTLIQLSSPDDLRGRIFSIYFWALQGVAPFGSLAIGALAQARGISATAVICGSICLLAVFVVHFSNPTIRKMQG
jgi:MFS family permease